ncbi:MAG TPA: AMP-dependent synthetase/ligase [Bryobacteraceae bacterium]|jgi:long-chain acyl-CoA synthetase|nr:AMP-dependent synthetase/ligase [Bryobacteraceae bacterium]
MPATTIPELLRDAAGKFGDRVALRQPDGKDIHTWTWNQYLTAAEEVAAGLKALGIEKGDHVALCSETRAEFYLADLGILTNGSVAAALYPSYPAEDLKRTIAMADAKALFVEDFKTLRKLGNLDGAGLRLVVVLTGDVPPGSGGGAISMSVLRTHGRYVAGISPEDNAILYLTSGATGEPKMVMVTHGAVVANVHAGPYVLPLDENDITIAFLPSAHIAQRVVLEILPILSATAVSFVESLAKLQHEIKTVRPTWFLAPPRVWERVYTSIRGEILKKPAIAQKMFFAALGLGLGAARYKREGKPVPMHIRFPLEIANRLIFGKIRDRFGGRLRVAASGAAPLGSDLAEFYEAIGMPLIEGYGLTEGGVTALNPLDAPRPGSIGKKLPHVEFRVSEEEGELLIRGSSLSRGYYKDPEATAELLRDGWLHTGDIGTIDPEGYIYITGRKKELIVASNGKKIFPSRVEAMFKFEPLISQVMLLGDRLPHLVALFTINPQIAETVAGVKESGKELHEAPQVIAEVQSIVSRINKQLAPFEQVKRFRVLPREFSIDFGEVTATMKVRRKQVMENFKADVDALYQLSSSGRGGE